MDKNYINPSKYELEKFTNTISTIFEKAEIEHKKTIERQELLFDLCYFMGGMVWVKEFDKKTRMHYYSYANPLYCETLFDFNIDRDSTYLNKIIGKTDIELMNYFEKKNMQIHTYSDICNITDNYTMEKGAKLIKKGKEIEPCTFLEFGWIGEQPLVLKSTKTPIFKEDGTYWRNIGNGLNITHQIQEEFEQLNEKLQNNQAIKLNKGVYYIDEEQTNIDNNTIKLIENEIEKP